MNASLFILGTMVGILAGIAMILTRSLCKANRRIDSLVCQVDYHVRNAERIEADLIGATDAAAWALGRLDVLDRLPLASHGDMIRDHDRLLVSIGRQLNRIEEGAAFRLNSAEHRLDAVDHWLGSQPDREVVAALLRSAADELDAPSEDDVDAPRRVASNGRPTPE